MSLDRCLSLLTSRGCAALLTLLLAPSVGATPIELRSVAGAVDYHEDFAALTPSPGSTLPAGWQFHETGSGANASYGAGRGTSSTGDTYSFGRDADRAFGSLRTTAVAAILGVAWRNADSVALGDINIAISGEQWRLGARDRVDRLLAEWSLDADSLTSGTWSALPDLDVASLVTSGALGALADPATTRLQSRLPGVLAPGATLWLRWRDIDASGADDGLAIDDVHLRARGERSVSTVPAPLCTASAALLLVAAIARGRRRPAAAR